MPSRFVSLAILIYWCVAAFFLLTWEVLPELSLGYSPDFRAIVSAGEQERPVAWTIQIIDDPKSVESRRTIGEAVTESRRMRDGWFELTSDVRLDAGGLFKENPFGAKTSVPLEIRSVYRVDSAGNLRSFDLKVSPRESRESLFLVRGRLKGNVMDVVSKGPLPMLNQSRSFLYEPRSVVQDALGPLDRLPGLHLGQRWDSRVISPFTGQVEKVRVEVQRRVLIHWNGEPVSAFEVVHHSGPFSATTWVRPDGLIIRQEVPFPLIHLVLERNPEKPAAAGTRGARP